MTFCIPRWWSFSNRRLVPHPASFFHPGQQPRFATCIFHLKSKERDDLCCQLGTLPIQLIICLTVPLSDGNCCDLITKFVLEPQSTSQNHCLLDIQSRVAWMQKHSTLIDDKPVDPSDTPTDLSRLDCLAIKFGKSQDLMKWFHCHFNTIHGFSLDQDQLATLLSENQQSPP